MEHSGDEWNEVILGAGQAGRGGAEPHTTAVLFYTPSSYSPRSGSKLSKLTSSAWAEPRGHRAGRGVLSRKTRHRPYAAPGARGGAWLVRFMVSNFPPRRPSSARAHAALGATPGARDEKKASKRINFRCSAPLRAASAVAFSTLNTLPCSLAARSLCAYLYSYQYRSLLHFNLGKLSSPAAPRPGRAAHAPCCLRRAVSGRPSRRAGAGRREAALAAYLAACRRRGASRR